MKNLKIMHTHSSRGKFHRFYYFKEHKPISLVYFLFYSANAKLETLTKTHSNEIKKLQAQLKKEEISRQSIMEQLAQKTKENEELVKICDELINNGGS